MASAALPAGCSLVANAVDAETEARLGDWARTEVAAGRERRLPHMGYVPPSKAMAERKQSREMLNYGAYVYNNRVQDVDAVPPIPPIVSQVVDALVKKGALPSREWADAVTVGVYDTGNWLPPHEDSRSFERPIVILSLESDEQEMAFGHMDGSRTFAETARARLPRRSVLVLDAPAADAPNLHALPAAPVPRVSVTFRRVSPAARVALAEERDAAARAGALQSLACAQRLAATPTDGLSRNEAKKLRRKAEMKAKKAATRLAEARVRDV